MLPCGYVRLSPSLPLCPPPLHPIPLSRWIAIYYFRSLLKTCLRLEHLLDCFFVFSFARLFFWLFKRYLLLLLLLPLARLAQFLYAFLCHI